MSLDLAVWDGPPPPSHADAAREYEDRTDAAEDLEEEEPEANLAIAAFLAELRERFPEPEESGEDTSVWHEDFPVPEAPDLVHLQLKLHVPEETGAATVAGIVAVAVRHGMVCFDPQIEEALTPLAPGGRRTAQGRG